MIVLFYLGWALLLAAFAAAAAETTARAQLGSVGIITSAYDLWYSIWPGALVVTQIRIEKIMPLLWDPILIAILAFPAWVLLGIPGVALTWFFRPNRYQTATEREEFRKHQDSYFLYDELEKEARTWIEDDGFDDRLPDHAGYDTLDELERLPTPTDDELLPSMDKNKSIFPDKS